VSRELELSQQTRDRLEAELRQLTTERSDLSAQLEAVIRQKNGTAEQLLQTRREHSAVVDQLSSDKQVLMSDKSQLAVQLTAAEQQSQQLNDVSSNSSSSSSSSRSSKLQVYSSSQGCYTATGTHMPDGMTQYYLPPGRGDIPALTPAEAGTRLSDPGGMQG